MSPLTRFRKDLLSRTSPSAMAVQMKPVSPVEAHRATTRAAFHLGIATERGEQAYHYHLEKK